MAIRVLGVIFSIAFSLPCGVLGYYASQLYFALIKKQWPEYFTGGVETFVTIAFIALGLLVGFKLANVIYRQLTNLVSVSAADKLAAVVGLVIGLVVAALLLPFLNQLVITTIQLRPIFMGMLYLLCIAGGIVLALSMRNEMSFFLAKPGSLEETFDEDQRLTPKLLDTNVIIDGRIADICRAGFVEGVIYIPGFVLEELQLIADSSDGLRRARGRRGLEVLSQIQKELKNVRVFDNYESPMPRNEAVDLKLVRLAKELDASIITNDYNLNKVASLQGISVLNVNELAAALKPVVLPGEDMTVTIVREGKELNQGIAYLDDGTMVVVEAGKHHINETLSVVVSSVLQTVAGKMIFANLRSEAVAK
jgi:uncharacterized protein YacL